MARRPRGDDPEQDEATETGAEAEAAKEHSVSGPRELNREELESLRTRLQKKFH